MLQDLVVYAVVALCTLYTVWMFLPAGPKRRLARTLMRLSPRLAASRHLQKAAADAGACGSGCDHCGSNPAAPVREHKVQMFRRR